jgi:hypothetical protein
MTAFEIIHNTNIDAVIKAHFNTGTPYSLFRGVTELRQPCKAP